MFRGFDCDSCTQEAKVERGCTIPCDTGIELDGESLDRCPIRVVTQETNVMLIAARHLELHNKYLVNGGLADQPARYLQAMDVIMAETTAMREAECQE